MSDVASPDAPDRDDSYREDGSPERLQIDTIRTLSMDAVQKANSGHPGTPMALAPVGHTLWTQVPALRSGHARLAQPRPLRAVGRPRLDAALRAAAPRRRRGDRRATASRPASPRSAWTTSSSSASSARRRRAIPNTATPPASRRPPGRSARAAAIRSAWRSPSAGWRRASTGPASRCSTTTSTSLCRRRRHDGGRRERGGDARRAPQARPTCAGSTTATTSRSRATTDLAFDEDVGKRFEAYGWNVIHVDDANDTAAIAAALETFRATDDQPDLDRRPLGHRLRQLRTRAATKAHGEALGEDDIRGTKQRLWLARGRAVPRARRRAARHFDDGDRRPRRGRCARRGRRCSRAIATPIPSSPQSSTLLLTGELPDGWDADIPSFDADAKGIATATPAARCSTRSRRRCRG